MQDQNILSYIKNVIENMPSDWLNLTTHRLDIYDESLAKTEFLDQFEALYNSNTYDSLALQQLPTAYDYIRLAVIECTRMGHCQLKWFTIKKCH